MVIRELITFYLEIMRYVALWLIMLVNIVFVVTNSGLLSSVKQDEHNSVNLNKKLLITI